MRNRWYHVPHFHVPTHGHHKKVTWLELFYDLIFVAGFIQLGNALGDKVTPGVFLGFCGVFAAMWLAWAGFTFYGNRFIVDDFTHRMMVFVKMITVGAMAVSAHVIVSGGGEGSYDHRGFAAAYALAQTLVALLYLRSFKQQEMGRAYSRYWGGVFALGALIWLASMAVPAPQTFILWAAALLLIMVAPMHRHSRELRECYPHDLEHLSERYGLLTLIVLGESFVKVLATLVEKGVAWSTMLQAGGALLVTFAVWWIYFDDVAGSKLKKTNLAMPIWWLSHLPLQIGITALGVALKKAVTYDVAAYPPYRWLLAGSLAMIFLAAAVIDSVSERRQAELSDRMRVNIRAASGILMLLMPIAGAGMTGFWFMVTVTVICALQVLFDMMMAPLESQETAESESKAEPAPGLHRAETATPRHSVRGTVRKGTPSAMRKDLYFFLIEGSWTRVFATVFVAYLLVNLVFAALFMFEPGAIRASRPDSFLDAFFFSVQTMSTIGYGVMAPATTYGHLIVTLEAAIGLLGVAMVTGLMFAKASRPHASVLFSDRIAISSLGGTPTLMFRLGNPRGNEIIDAKLTFSALVDEITPEGHRFNRILDLELQRDRTPYFNLTWTLYHSLDENSPLKDFDIAGENDLVGLRVTVSGHDGTYGQTIHSRHLYDPGNIVCDHRFVDVHSELPDGRPVVDFGRFHDLVPDTPAESHKRKS